MPQTIIHIGFPKTGSTFMQAYFESHPNIHHNRSRFEEYAKTGVISDHIIEELNNGETHDVLSEELLAIWQGNTVSDELKTYNLEYDIRQQQKEVAKNLYNFLPTAKILIITRNYESLLTSLYSQALFIGEIFSVRNFSKSQQEIILHLFNYDYVISAYQKYFGTENVLILPSEFLKDNPKAFLAYIEEHYGLTHHEFDTDAIHSSLNTVSAKMIRLMNNLMMIRMKLILNSKKRKKKFLDYIAWLYEYKERLNKSLKVGKKIHIPTDNQKRREFNNQSKLVKFEQELQKYNQYYKN